MMNNLNNDLDALRAAALQREWTALQDAFKRLLARLEPLIALEIAAAPVVQHLPRFEFYYPEARWVRELLLTVVSYASSPGDLPKHAVTQFPSPGCGNFVSAVLDLARAVQPKHTVFERYSFITNAAANVILADLMDFYYSQRPALWQNMLDSPDQIDPHTGLTLRQQTTMTFWTDPDVAARDTAAWLALAEAVAEKLNRVRAFLGD